MAKRKGPLGLLFKGLLLLAIVAGLAVVGVSLFYPDEDLGSQLRGAGVPEPQIKQVLNIKGQIKNKADMSGDDLLFSAKSVWWGLRDRFDLDLTSFATIDLPAVHHVTQKPGMVKDSDPKEPKEETTAPPEVTTAAGQETPTEAPMPAEAMKADDVAALPPETPAEPAAAPEAMPMPEPAAPPATDKPMDLSKAPEPEKAEVPMAAAPAEAPKTEEVAALPAQPVAEPAPAPPPPATAEERLANADLTYKTAVSLFSKAQSADEKAEVARLFAQAAIDGHPDAQYSIGVMHYNGIGVAQDYAKAAEWFGRAAEKSNASAQYNLGILYYNGQGVTKDDKLAYKWISAAAENGDKKAIVARDTLKEALPSEVTKPAASSFSNTPAPAAPTEITPKAAQ